MKKVLILILALVFAQMVFLRPAIAAGDKVRGEKGAGETVQECENFDGCPYGDESPVK